MVPKLTPDAAYRLAKALLKSGGPRDPRLEAVIAQDPELFYGYEQEMRGKPAGYITYLNTLIGVGRTPEAAEMDLTRQIGGSTQMYKHALASVATVSPLFLQFYRLYGYFPEHVAHRTPFGVRFRLADED